MKKINVTLSSFTIAMLKDARRLEDAARAMEMAEENLAEWSAANRAAREARAALGLGILLDLEELELEEE